MADNLRNFFVIEPLEELEGAEEVLEAIALLDDRRELVPAEAVRAHDAARRHDARGPPLVAEQRQVPEEVAGFIRLGDPLAVDEHAGLALVDDVARVAAVALRDDRLAGAVRPMPRRARGALELRRIKRLEVRDLTPEGDALLHLVGTELHVELELTRRDAREQVRRTQTAARRAVRHPKPFATRRITARLPAPYFS